MINSTRVCCYLQILQVINPRVTNANGSTQFVAIVLSELGKLGVPCDKREVEVAVTSGRCGNIKDNRYFLKDGIDSASISAQPKHNLRKVRCCAIKEVLSTELLRRLNKGKNSTECEASFYLFEHCLFCPVTSCTAASSRKGARADVQEEQESVPEHVQSDPPDPHACDSESPSPSQPAHSTMGTDPPDIALNPPRGPGDPSDIVLNDCPDPSRGPDDPSDIALNDCPDPPRGPDDRSDIALNDCPDPPRGPDDPSDITLNDCPDPPRGPDDPSDLVRNDCPGPSRGPGDPSDIALNDCPDRPCGPDDPSDIVLHDCPDPPRGPGHSTDPPDIVLNDYSDPPRGPSHSTNPSDLPESS